MKLKDRYGPGQLIIPIVDFAKISEHEKIKNQRVKYEHFLHRKAQLKCTKFRFQLEVRNLFPFKVADPQVWVNCSGKSFSGRGVK